MTHRPSGGEEQSLATGAPLVLDAKCELLFFRTAAQLEGYVEAVDVANDEYGDCWDSEGRLLTLSIQSRSAKLLGIVPVKREVVHAQYAEETATHLADLHEALLRHLSAVGLEREMPLTNDTADLLAFAIERAGWS